MPRFFTILAVLAPVFSILWVCRSFIPVFDLVASLPLSWPLAVHPDYEDKQYAYVEDDSDQKPLEISDFVDHHRSKQHEHHVPVAAHTEPAKGEFVRRIVAVGDLHGDMPNALEVLQMAGVVDDNGDWSGEVDFFVQTGDIIDRGDDTIKLYLWMDKLRDQAKAVGGTVLTNLGNHEWMNAIGDWRYVHASEIKTFGSVAARQKMLATGRIGRTWATNYTTASRLPLHPSLGPPNTDYDPSSPFLSDWPLSHAAISFVHGGLAPTYPDLTPFPSRINEISTSLLHKLQHRTPQPPPHPPNPYPGLPHDATLAEHRLYGSDGPLWYRGWALDPEEKVCKEVDDVLKKTGTRRMVMGHTPDFQKIVSRCDGKIIIIDTGISHAYGGALSALSVTYTLTPADDASGEKKWTETEVVKALYLDKEVVLAKDEREVVGDFV
ncbi:Metallo-dependent phosphatase [Lentinus tigrinus ALCF2SS1-7]|uniref:Metallo-dependent phosphatase n=1 Tax=Lentinus tigrinus ALCF2SS1-6 TaxID=1328759 RepID=A0A5C2SAC1_9APHY|nr:Metallo-dependent phosphatase [Lentinus tigrinus ALCF2SS1-6]RPD74813.1 Metallo-dependent phosphatase [Lentinus tigrinus ALCF2SS1-7]